MLCASAPPRLAYISPSPQDRLSALATVYERAALSTQAAEKTVEEIARATSAPSVAQQVGDILLRRGMKAADILRLCTPNVAWDAGSGEVRLSLAKLEGGVRQLGVVAGDEAILEFVTSVRRARTRDTGLYRPVNTSPFAYPKLSPY